MNTLKILTGVLAAFVWSGAVSASDCDSIGSPSYAAKRVVKIGPSTIVSKVYVSGKKTREEVDKGDDIEVVINTAKGTTVFLQNRQEGFRLPLPPKPKKRGESKIEEKKVGKNTEFTHFLKSENGNWFVDVVILCNPEGVMLKRDFVTLLDQKAVPTSITQTDIRLGSQPASLFSVPSGIAIR